MVFHSLVFLSRISIFFVQYAFYDDNMSLIITISQFSTRWENVENLKVLRFLLKKLWNEWECLTSVRTVLITCQKNRSYSFLDYQYYFNSYHQRKYKLRIESLNDFCQKISIFELEIKGSAQQSHFIFEINAGKRRIRHATTLKYE